MSIDILAAVSTTVAAAVDMCKMLIFMALKTESKTYGLLMKSKCKCVHLSLALFSSLSFAHSLPVRVSCVNVRECAKTAVKWLRLLSIPTPFDCRLDPTFDRAFVFLFHFPCVILSIRSDSRDSRFELTVAEHSYRQEKESERNNTKPTKNAIEY